MATPVAGHISLGTAQNGVSLLTVGAWGRCAEQAVNIWGLEFVSGRKDCRGIPFKASCGLECFGDMGSVIDCLHVEEM